ncbi:unnamed protein product [Chrysoparadoxa australica]
MDDPLLNYHDAVLYEKDTYLLRTPSWLNDNVVAFYFRSAPFFLFSAYFASSLPVPLMVRHFLPFPDDDLRELCGVLKLCTSDLAPGAVKVVYTPITDNESFQASSSHWSLLVCHKCCCWFSHYDSGGGRNNHAANAVARQFSKLLNGVEDAQIDHVKWCPQQENGYDCGMYCCCMAEWLAKRSIKGAGTESEIMACIQEVTPMHVSAQRKALLEFIQRMTDGQKEI